MKKEKVPPTPEQLARARKILKVFGIVIVLFIAIFVLLPTPEPLPPPPPLTQETFNKLNYSLRESYLKKWVSDYKLKREIKEIAKQQCTYPLTVEFTRDLGVHVVDVDSMLCRAAGMLTAKNAFGVPSEHRYEVTFLQEVGNVKWLEAKVYE